MVTEYSIRSVEPIAPDPDLSVRPASVPPPRQIPWGYDRDRVTAVAIDPNQLFAYWELRDETLEAVREQLGPGGADAALTLRVYDTSGRIFDGHNAHGFFDQDVHRTDRQWFCRVGKPSSSAHVEMGLRARDGRFVRIVRSGRVDFPRSGPAPGGPVEWMRVVAQTGAIETRQRTTPPAAAPPAPDELASTGSDGKSGVFAAFHELQTSGQFEHAESTPLFEQASRESWEWYQREAVHFDTDSGWVLDENDPNLSYRMLSQRWEEFGIQSFRWESGPVESAWQAGPFTYPTEVIAPAIERYEGPRQVFRSGEQVRVLHGPWQVIIKGINPHAERRVLARWEVHRSWVSVATRSSEGYHPGALPGQGLRPGASERLPLGASELRLRGASEVFYLGASERRLGGASESRFLGASLLVLRGASERRLVGQSELRIKGQSELRLLGQSERRLAGQSELRLLGASERRLGGASELWGASERRLGGASERRLGPGEGRLVPREPDKGKSLYPRKD